MKIKKLLGLLLCVAAAQFHAVAAMDLCLEIDGIPGEARDKGHPGAIEVLAWSWGMSNASFPIGGGGGAGKVQVQDLSITKSIDKATSPLMQACANGKHIKKAVLYLRKTGGKPTDFFKVTMEDVIISSVGIGGRVQDDVHAENVSLNFARFKVEYMSQDAKGGTSADGSFHWDLGANKAD